jgi:hypothetical protein
MKVGYMAVLLGFLCCAVPVTGNAEELSADQILARTDARYNGFKDQEMDIELIVFNTDGKKKSYSMNLRQLGTEKRLVRFTSGEVKGMSMLTESIDRMYVYLPGYKKVRRLASHNVNQAFMGSDFSNSDMATAAYSDFYNASIHQEDDKFWHLKLTPKNDSVQYGHLVMKVEKGTFMYWRLEFYNKKSEMVKLLENQVPKTFPGVTEPWHTEMTMSDPRTKHKTILKVNNLQLDQGLKKSLFTTRQLKWGK